MVELTKPFSVIIKSFATLNKNNNFVIMWHHFSFEINRQIIQINYVTTKLYSGGDSWHVKVKKEKKR